MNYSIIRKILGIVIQFTGAFLALPAICGLIYQEKQAIVYVVLSILYFVAGRIISSFKLSSQAYYAREGLVIVGMSWIVISILGAIPLVITKDIPNFTDALFETVSGFTTTGSSILSDVEALSHTGLFWRSFTHWVGGMGVIVFILAVLPMTGGYNMNLMRAESPGPTVGKLVPRMKDTAKILYGIYLGITVAEIIILIIAGMPLFDALCISFGSAGTGGFGVRNDSCASYSTLMQSIITVFILMFGVNFNAYFFILRRKFGEVLKMSELKGYFGIVAFSIITITINIRGMFPSLYARFDHVRRRLRGQYRRRYEGLPNHDHVQDRLPRDPQISASARGHKRHDGRQDYGQKRAPQRKRLLVHLYAPVRVVHNSHHTV